MSERLHTQANQENSHRVAPKVLRNENAPLAMPQKRPLSSLANSGKRARVPLGGKDQNTLVPSLQRSKSSFAPQNPKGAPRPSVLAAQPVLARSNSSLGFSHDPYNIVHHAPLRKLPPKTNPHKNSLLSPQEAPRSKNLVPRFSSDSLRKKDTAPKPPVARLSSTFSDATRGLHANNIPATETAAEPVKRGALSAQLDSEIEALANDESSVETVPERPAPLEYVPSGLEPLTAEEAPFLQEKKRLVDMFDGDFFDEAAPSKPSDATPLGLSEADMNSLLDF